MAPARVLDREDVTIYRDPFAYISHPTVAQAGNGDYLVAYNESLRRGRRIHPPGDPRYVNLLSRSRDRGRTWEMPRVAPGYEWTGVECPSITQISIGEVLMVQWQFSWYPLETARKMWEEDTAPSEIMIFDGEGRGLIPPESGADWDRSPYPWARGDSGCFAHISSDHGATWDHTAKVDTGAHARGYSPRPPTELSDGTLLLALGSHEPKQVSFVVRSTDAGRSWGFVVDATPRDPVKRFGEPTILALPSGKLIMIIRVQATGYLHQCDSHDGGFTWTPVRETAMWGYPAHLVLLSDGRVLCIYGHRRPPYGIRACLSTDEGGTWDYDNELIIRDDMLNEDLGYPTAIEEADGRIFAAYYGQDAEGVTYVMGSHFRLP